MQTADNCDLLHLQIQKAGKFAAFIERPKARRVSASEGALPPDPPPLDQGLCHLHIALLILFRYLMGDSTEKVSFHWYHRCQRTCRTGCVLVTNSA